MPLPIPNLDDRRFDDLVAEARARLASHLPELTQVAPGDPVHSLIDLFAFFTETILYRVNLIPERQRRMVLNLLQIPLRRARPSRGVVCIDAGQRALTLPSLIRDGVQLKGGRLTCTGSGELQPTPLSLIVAAKQPLSEKELLAMGLTLRDLREQYGLRRDDRPRPFQPKYFQPGKEPMLLKDSIDKRLYLALVAPRPLQNSMDELRKNLSSIILNIAVAPQDRTTGEEIHGLSPRNLTWELMSRDEQGNLLALPLEVVADSSRGARRTGVVRLRLPDNEKLLDPLENDDPMFAGQGERPPELPETVKENRVVCWLRLSCPDEPDLQLGYLGVNGLEVIGQGMKKDLVVGTGTGNPDQVINLPDTQIDPDSLVLEIEEGGAWVPWERVDFLVGQGENARIYRLDAAAGHVYFGDGLEAGKRPPKGKRIRIARYLYGGGASGNVDPGTIRELSEGSSRLTVRQEWPLEGGRDAETVAEAERRIPAFLTHRNRAVTSRDFKLLAENNPVTPVARAEILEGFLPGPRIEAARTGVPGVVSVFILPPGRPALGSTPKPDKGMLKDVFEYLVRRVLLGTEIYVLSPEFIPMAIGVRVEVLDPETEQQTLQDVQKALTTFLWPIPPGGVGGEGWGMGNQVDIGELHTRVARVEGIRTVKAISLFLKDDKGWRRLGQDESIMLKQYQLPELSGVSVGTGSGLPSLPGGLEALADTGRDVPAPVIPEVC